MKKLQLLAMKLQIMRSISACQNFTHIENVKMCWMNRLYREFPDESETKRQLWDLIFDKKQELMRVQQGSYILSQINCN